MSLAAFAAAGCVQRRRLSATPAAMSSFLLDISNDYINTKSLKNQSDLARALKTRFHSPLAFDAFEAIDRALFLPTNGALTYREPYANIPQPFGVGNANMSTPIHHALVLDTLHVHAGLKPGSRVLDIGCGSGYLTAALYKTVGLNGMVVGVDRIPELVSMAKQCLQDCPITAKAQGNLHVHDAYVNDAEWNRKALELGAPYDAIHVGFSFQPESSDDAHGDLALLLQYLRGDGGNARLLAGWGDALCLFDSKGYRKEIANLPGLAKKETGTYVKPPSRQARMERAKQELDTWKQAFESTNARKPNKNDLLSDPIASALFKEFSLTSNKFGGA